MENTILFENVVCEYLGIPSIPKKKWDGESEFQKGVAIIDMIDGTKAYAVARCDEKGLRITKVFNITPFSIPKDVCVYVVPTYMDVSDIDNMDLDDESKKRAASIVKESKDIEDEGVESHSPYDNLPEWIFPEIEDKEQAIAWLAAYRNRNKIKGKIPTKDDSIKNCLIAIYAEERSRK